MKPDFHNGRKIEINSAGRNLPGEGGWGEGMNRLSTSPEWKTQAQPRLEGEFFTKRWRSISPASPLPLPAAQERGQCESPHSCRPLLQLLSYWCENSFCFSFHRSLFHKRSGPTHKAAHWAERCAVGLSWDSQHLLNAVPWVWQRHCR